MSEDAALGALLSRLKALDYRFTTVTPATHARVLARPFDGPPTLRDIFGWSRPFREADLEPDLLRLLEDANALDAGPNGLRSAYRVSSLGDDLLLHSAFPTDGADSIFFGPDTYRFARFICACLPKLQPPESIVDMGCGSGAGGIVAAHLAPNARIRLVDLNPAALRIARINARTAGIDAEIVEASRLPDGADLILANPPYMIDPAGRAYRDGGGLLGGEVALAWVTDALGALRPGGSMLLYTGAAEVDGRMPLVAAVQEACSSAGGSVSIEEIDPDLFGEELDLPSYRSVERIAAIGMTVQLPH